MKDRAPLPVAALPVTFHVGRHAVVVVRRERRWSVSIDAVPSEATFDTEAEAWEAGVREADRLDRQPPQR